MMSLRLFDGERRLVPAADSDLSMSYPSAECFSMLRATALPALRQWMSRSG